MEVLQFGLVDCNLRDLSPALRHFVCGALARAADVGFGVPLPRLEKSEKPMYWKRGLWKFYEQSMKRQ